MVFLYGQNEIEIYYFLLNQAEIKYFDDLKFEMAIKSVKHGLLSHLGQLLFAWTGKQWDVGIAIQLEILTLRDQLVNEIKLGREWELITSHFRSVEITDILLKR